jgi:hypothetical protein
MQRRNVNVASGPDLDNLSATSGSTGGPNKLAGASPRRQSSRDSSLPPARTLRNMEFCSTRVLLVVAVLVTAATYMFPADVQSAEHQAHEAYKVEQELEREMFDWWQKGGHKPPLLIDTDHEDSKETATQAMLKQDSKWVDGEKKLKQKLKELATRQEQGKDLGVPVLTRYLGEEIPAWAGEGVNVDEWNKKVAAKYDEMRQEEEEWKKMMQGIIGREKRG